MPIQHFLSQNDATGNQAYAPNVPVYRLRLLSAVPDFPLVDGLERRQMPGNLHIVIGKHAAGQTRHADVNLGFIIVDLRLVDLAIRLRASDGDATEQITMQQNGQNLAGIAEIYGGGGIGAGKGKAPADEKLVDHDFKDVSADIVAVQFA